LYPALVAGRKSRLAGDRGSNHLHPLAPSHPQLPCIELIRKPVSFPRKSRQQEKEIY
jgi:hypothetical protein